MVVDASAVGFHVTDVVDLAVAATAGDHALVSFAVDGDHGCPYDGCYVTHDVFTFTVGSGPPRVTAPPTSAVGVSPSESAAPLVLDDELLLLTQGHAGAAPMSSPGQAAADTLFLVRGRDVVQRSEKWFSGVFAARGVGSSALVVGTGQESGWQRNLGTAASVRALVVSAGGIGKGELVLSAAAPDARYDAPAVVANADRGALAFREQTGAGATVRGRVFVAWVDPRTGKATGQLAPLASGDVGKPALLLDDDVLRIVWSQRASTHEPYELRYATWRAGDAAPGASVLLPTTTRSALSPSLARVGDSYAVAFMDSADTRHGAVHAGFAADSLEHAASAARPVSAADVVNARDPRWGDAGSRAILAWSEHSAAGARVRWTWCGAR